MSSNVRDVPERVEDLATCELVSVLHGLHVLTGRQGADDRRYVDTGTLDARLTEPDLWVHRDARKDLHGETIASAAPRYQGLCSPRRMNRPAAWFP